MIKDITYKIILFPLPYLYNLINEDRMGDPIVNVILFALDIIIYFFILKIINQYYKNRLVFVISVFIFVFVLIYNLIIIYLYLYLSSGSFTFR